MKRWLEEIWIAKSFSWWIETSTAQLRGYFIPLAKGGEKPMATVVLRPNESQDSLLKRFRKKVVKSGVLSTIRRKRWFVSKSETRRVEKKKAIRRIKRKAYPPKYGE